MTSIRMTIPTRLVLGALADGCTWGYTIGAQTSLQFGTIYPILARLAAHGLVTVTNEEDPHPGRPARRYYALTEAGRQKAAAFGARMTAA